MKTQKDYPARENRGKERLEDYICCIVRHATEVE